MEITVRFNYKNTKIILKDDETELTVLSLCLAALRR